jgi:hypothetical protein
MNRPFAFDAIPITLLQREFGTFQDDRALVPSATAQALLLSLTSAACQWYSSETFRRSAVQTVFKEKGELYFAAEAIHATEYKTDGNLFRRIMPAAIRECKNEKGCALYEAIAYYSQFLKLNLTPDARNTRFPSILLLDVGMFFACCFLNEL